jgi:hypothetical protein
MFSLAQTTNPALPDTWSPAAVVGVVTLIIGLITASLIPAIISLINSWRAIKQANKAESQSQQAQVVATAAKVESAASQKSIDRMAPGLHQAMLNAPPPNQGSGPRPSLLLFPILCLLMLQGCLKPSAVKPGNDPVLVNMERSYGAAVDTLDSFFKYEYENRSMLPKAAVDFAADMRPKAKKLIIDTDAGIKLYRSTRVFADGKTAEGRLSDLQELAKQARLKLIELQSHSSTEVIQPPLRKAA